jgi:hypothetical protein
MDHDFKIVHQQGAPRGIPVRVPLLIRRRLEQMGVTDFAKGKLIVSWRQQSVAIERWELRDSQLLQSRNMLALLDLNVK